MDEQSYLGHALLPSILDLGGDLLDEVLLFLALLVLQAKCLVLQLAEYRSHV